MNAVRFTIGLAATAGAFAAPADARGLSNQERQAITTAVAEKLREPASAQFKWNDFPEGKLVYCGFVNAKNGFGGYTGFEPFAVLLGADVDGQTIVTMVQFDVDAYSTCMREGFNVNPGMAKQS